METDGLNFKQFQAEYQRKKKDPHTHTRGLPALPAVQPNWLFDCLLQNSQPELATTTTEFIKAVAMHNGKGASLHQPRGNSIAGSIIEEFVVRTFQEVLAREEASEGYFIVLRECLCGMQEGKLAAVIKTMLS